MGFFKNKSQVTTSTQLLGKDTVDMLARVHQDALWILENLGIGCKYPDIVAAFDAAYKKGAIQHYMETGQLENIDRFIPLSN